MVPDPGRTPGKAEGPHKKEQKARNRKDQEEVEPGRTPDQAEGVDPEQEEQARQKLRESMRHDGR